MSGPIPPAEAKRGTAIPEVVFEVVNSLLSQGQRNIKQDEVLRLLGERGVKRRDAFALHMLDFEDAYRSVGWEVEYDKPAHNETYSASWSFSP